MKTAARLVVYVDDSPQSAAVLEALQTAGWDAIVVRSDNPFGPIPAVETPAGVIRGYANISRYLLPLAKHPERIHTLPALSAR